MWYSVELNHDVRDFTPLHISILPKHHFVCDEYWLITFSSLSNSPISKQVILQSPAEDSNPFLSICSRMHTAMSASRTFAESIPIFIGMHRINGDGLANHYITTLSTLQNIFEDEERFELSTWCLTNTCSAVELFIRWLARWDSNSQLPV